ncbi:MAG: hypothetical protein ACK4IY_00215, partial [Chitinophagales bacterium]
MYNSLKSILVISIMLITACKNQKDNTGDTDNFLIEYPVVKTVDTVDNYFGTLVKDPYRWLENENDPEVAQWVSAQNAVTFAYLQNIPYRNQIKNRLTELNNYPKMTNPYRVGRYYFYAKNTGLQNQYVTFFKEGINGEEKIFLDPNALSADGTVSASVAGFSHDKKYAAISISNAGSDWNEMYVRELATNKELTD